MTDYWEWLRGKNRSTRTKLMVEAAKERTRLQEKLSKLGIVMNNANKYVWVNRVVTAIQRKQMTVNL